MEIRAAVFRDNSLKPSIETLEMSEPGAGERRLYGVRCRITGNGPSPGGR